MASIIERDTHGTSLQRVEYYLDQAGDLVAYDETNKHHGFWENDWYKGPKERHFREMHAWYFRLKIPVHCDLHAALDPPPKPGQRAMDVLTEFANEHVGLPQLAQLEAAIEYLDEQAGIQHCYMGSKVASRLCTNLLAQQPYIIDGIVTPFAIGPH